MKNRKEQNSSLTNLHKFFPAKPCTYSPTPSADPISSAQQSAPSYASPAPTVPYAPSRPRSAARTQRTGANSPGSAVKFIIYGVISSSFNSLIRSNPVSAVIKARLFSIADAAIIASGSLTLYTRLSLIVLSLMLSVITIQELSSRKPRIRASSSSVIFGNDNNSISLITENAKREKTYGFMHSLPDRKYSTAFVSAR